MICVYIRTTKGGTYYTGSTIDLERRMREHMSGHVLYTKTRRPVQLYAYREFNDIKEAALWEKKYKRSSGQRIRDLQKGILRWSLL